MRYLPLVVVLMLSACAAPPQRSLPPVVDGPGAQPPAQAPAEPLPQAGQTVPAAPSTSGAVIALLDRADHYRSTGDAGGEAATIERALRIDPNNARLWNRLAATRLEQGQPQQAEQLALKSNALAAGDAGLRAQNWRLVAKARWAMNDAAGARAAEAKAREFSGS